MVGTTALTILKTEQKLLDWEKSLLQFLFVPQSYLSPVLHCPRL